MKDARIIVYIDLIVNLQYLRLSTVYTTYSQTALEIQDKVKLDPMRICIIILNLEYAERFKNSPLVHAINCYNIVAYSETLYNYDVLHDVLRTLIL